MNRHEVFFLYIFFFFPSFSFHVGTWFSFSLRALFPEFLSAFVSFGARGKGAVCVRACWVSLASSRPFPPPMQVRIGWWLVRELF